jgi:hypothetical protein
LAVSAGSLPSILWCVIRLSRAANWGLFGHGQPTKIPFYAH